MRKNRRSKLGMNTLCSMRPTPLTMSSRATAQWQIRYTARALPGEVLSTSIHGAGTCSSTGGGAGGAGGGRVAPQACPVAYACVIEGVVSTLCKGQAGHASLKGSLPQHIQARSSSVYAQICVCVAALRAKWCPLEEMESTLNQHTPTYTRVHHLVAHAHASSPQCMWHQVRKAFGATQAEV